MVSHTPSAAPWWMRRRPCLRPPPGRTTWANRKVLGRQRLHLSATIGHRLFTDGVTSPVYEDDRGQYVVEDGERIDGLFLVPEGDEAGAPLVVRLRED